MFERPKAGQKALLVHLDFPGSDFESDRQEFVELARSAGAEILDVIGGSRREADPGLFVGSGKAQEIADAVAASGAELVIFNHALSPSQERNLEKIAKARVVDRSGLILDIFATRARSHEGKLQVELAQLQHVATRLIRGWTHLERQRGGGIGLRGPGETQLEMDRRLIRGRIATLKRHLETVRSRRAQNRASRVRNNVPTASIVGYTNAGKSTLFNAVTGDDTFASNQLFATLDTTVRRLPLQAGDPVLLADTVGFIRDLPHDLVAAFRATLEEARDAELLLHVVDAADPERMTRIQQVEDVLHEIGADDVPTLQVFNKIDLREDEAPRIERDEHGVPFRVYVSARERLGLDLLKDAIAERVLPQVDEQALVLPPSAARLRAQLFTHHAVRGEDIDTEGNFHLRVAMPYERLRGLCVAAGIEPPPSPHLVEEWELSP
ncbi:ribosome rescue GTPase HflX [Solimonas marina]|uniref:GTPase HflX n=1 Tax=Solimonas marina TaxID=2714601 RepID=A0A970B6D0_9GAMM|nr:ribosome rescue GTPase HflX [Solimonas marina]NKF22505.1 GTPase HflX [Solimonas marina]